MAKFLDYFSYKKEGPGVKKDQPQKKRPVLFFEIFFRKVWKLMQLNLLFLLFCLPVITIGPAVAGLTYVLRNYAREEHAFLFSDFWDAFRSNLKQSLAYSALMALAIGLLSFCIHFYSTMAAEAQWMLIPMGFSIATLLFVIMMSFYSMTIIVTFDMPLKAILKNSAIFAITCLKTNLITFAILAAVIFISVNIPLLGMLLAIFLLFSGLGLVVVFNTYPHIKKYMIDPGVPEDAPQNNVDSIFNDTI